MEVRVAGKWVNFETAVSLMDDEIRERLHSDMAPCSEQLFIDTYCREHAHKFNEIFIVN